MENIISQLMLPIVLAIVMLGMGLNLQVKDFKALLHRPKAAMIGLTLQMLLLPVLALFIIHFFALNKEIAAGLFLIALCPGGATSNLFSYFAKGNLALSVCLTGIVSVLSPVILPLAFVGFIHFSGSIEVQSFSLPLIPAMKKLALVTLLPTLIGMCIRHYADDYSKSLVPLVKRLSALAMCLLICALIFTNLSILPAMFSLYGIAVMTLCSVSLVIAYFITAQFKVTDKDRKTIAIEVGVQNAGTAMMVALSIMQQPALAMVPLMYGLLMNIPAFIFVGWVSSKDKVRLPISVSS